MLPQMFGFFRNSQVMVENFANKLGICRKIRKIEQN